MKEEEKLNRMKVNILKFNKKSQLRNMLMKLTSSNLTIFRKEL